MDTPAAINTVDTGLDGVPVCASDLSHTTLGPDGKPILLYRGYSIYDLVQGPFAESVYLLLHNELPNAAQLRAFAAELGTHAALAPEITAHLRTYPRGVNMMDLLLTALSYARLFDPDYHNPLWQKPRVDEALGGFLRRAGLRLGAKIPAIIASGYRIQQGLAPIPPDPAADYALDFLRMSGLDTAPDAVAALNTVLILYLDHTINCSTFTALVAESAMTDPYGPLLAAGVALKGVRHGGANERAAAMFDEIGSPERAEGWLRAKLRAKEIIFGFGHRLQHYKHNVESRVTIAERVGRPLAEKRGWGHYFAIYDIISRIMLEEKNRTPNADLPVCLILKALGLPKELNTPLFQASRHFGWLANIIRQRLSCGPLYRPTQRYTGAGADHPRPYAPLAQRGGDANA